jgi:hypothetical protein
MSMYVELLTSALDEPLVPLDGDALVDQVLTCRAELLALGSHHGKSAYAALAVEVAYDRALLQLAAASGIAAASARFMHPKEERQRLERELAAAGVDLVALAQRTGDC